MFDVGFSEIMLIMVIALIVVGPERLPKLARTIGTWVGKARTIVNSVKSEVEREIRVDELKKSIQQQTPVEEFKQLAGELKSVGSDLEATNRGLRTDVAASGSVPGKPNGAGGAAKSGMPPDDQAPITSADSGANAKTADSSAASKTPSE